MLKEGQRLENWAKNKVPLSPESPNVPWASPWASQYDRQHRNVPASGAKIEAVIFLSHWERKKKKNEFLSCQKGMLYVHAHILQDKNNFIQFLTSFRVSEQTDSEDLQGSPGCPLTPAKHLIAPCFCLLTLRTIIMKSSPQTEGCLTSVLTNIDRIRPKSWPGDTVKGTE